MRVFVLTLSLLYFREFLGEFVYVFGHMLIYFILCILRKKLSASIP